MRCEDASAELSARAHDEGDGDEDVATISHLDDCPDCAAFERDLEPIRDFWREARDPGSEIDLPGDAWDRLRTRIADEPQMRRRSRAILWLPVLAAAAAILIFAYVIQPAIERDLAFETRYGDFRIEGRLLESGRSARLAPDTPLRNPGPGVARIDIEDATIILAAGAALTWRADAEFSLVEGAALIRTSRPLTLHTGETRIDVLGTRFAVERAGSGVTVLVAEGRVRFTGPGGAVTLPRGTRSFCGEDGRPTPPDTASPWPALDWLGGPRLELSTLPCGSPDSIELEILVATDFFEDIPIRPFTDSSPDFLLEIVDPEGRRFPLKILPAMVVTRTALSGHRVSYPIVRGRPYRLHLRLRGTDVGSAPGAYTISASYNVRGPATDSLWQGRLTSKPCRIER
jgi:ferric-dicitrate binding protein FerR (iron transport regulator)